MKLVTAATMRELDRQAIGDVGLPGLVLMEAAGRGTADAVEELLRASAGRSALILCGPGNNGGDGFVIARHLADRGFEGVVALLGTADGLKGDAASTFRMLARFPVRVVECPAGVPSELWDRPWDVVVDAMFGTGLARPVEGPFADAVERANALPCPRVAVDLPTGVDADTGRVSGVAFRANLTVTFGVAKIGHWSYPGRGFTGRLEVVPIGIPRTAIDAAPGAVLIGRGRAAGAFPPRAGDAFKNRYGHLVVVGGLPGKAGAALLAAMAAVRSGAGLVTLATHHETAARIEGLHPELMVEGPLTSKDEWIRNDARALETVLQGKTAAVLGPGLSTRPGAAAVVAAVLESGLPAVIDADALNLLADDPDTAAGLGPTRVITPHPGEAARLLGGSSADVQADRVTAARELARRTGAVAVLKGAGTVVAAPDGRLAINATGGPGLATAGSGDVLAGIVGALLARGLPPFEAACAGVYVHGRAGDLATGALTEHSVGASDVVEALAGAILELTAEGPGNR